MLQTLQTLHILLARLIPQPTGIPRPHQWLLMGVQACRLPALKPLKTLKRLKPLKPLKLCKSFAERPTAGKSYPKATSIASSGRFSLPLARRHTLQTLQTLQHSLGMPNPAANRYPKPHQWLLMGVKPAVCQPLKPLKPLKPP